MVLGLSNNLKIKFGSEKNCVQTITVEWPVSKVREKIEDAYKKVQAKVKMPGFRPGKTPIDVVKQTYKETAFAEAQESLLEEGVTEALQSKKINPVQSPVVQSLQFDPDKAFHFEFKVEVAPNFKISNYRGLKLTKKEKTVDDQAVQKTINEIAQTNARLTESKEEILKKTHFAIVDYEGFFNGKPIEGAKTENFLIDMSKPQIISGLAEGLEGIKVGEQREISVQFPEDSPAKDLAGKDALFHVKLNAIKEKQVPIVDDAFAKDLGMESLDKLKEKVRENLVVEWERTERQNLEEQIGTKLLEDNKFSLPPQCGSKAARFFN